MPCKLVTVHLELTAKEKQQIDFSLKNRVIWSGGVINKEAFHRKHVEIRRQFFIHFSAAGASEATSSSQHSQWLPWQRHLLLEQPQWSPWGCDMCDMARNQECDSLEIPTYSPWALCSRVFCYGRAVPATFFDSRRAPPADCALASSSSSLKKKIYWIVDKRSFFLFTDV